MIGFYLLKAFKRSGEYNDVHNIEKDSHPTKEYHLRKCLCVSFILWVGVAHPAEQVGADLDIAIRLVKSAGFNLVASYTGGQPSAVDLTDI